MANPAIISPATNPQNAPHGVDRVVAEGTRYLSESATAAGTVSSELLDKELFRQILDTEPTPYTTLLTLLFSMAPKSVDDLEFAQHESGVSFGPLVVDVAGAALVPAVANTVVTQTIPITAAGFTRIGLNMIVGYPTGSAKGTVTTINSGAGTIVVSSQTGQPLPALVSGDTLTTGHGELVFDGQSGVYSFRRPTTIARYNYIQEIRVLEKWNRNEEEVWRRKGRTDYMSFKEKKLKRDFQYMLAINFLNGKRGQYASTVSGEYTRGMHGMWPWMQEYGATYVPTPVASGQAVFEAISHNTNYSSNDIIVLGHQEALQLFASWYKNQLVRYEPNDMIANLDLDAIRHAGRNFILTPCNAFRESGMFEPGFANRVFLYDRSLMRPVKFGARDLIERINPTKQIKDGDGSFRTFSVMGYEGMISYEMGNTDHSAAIDFTDL